MSPFSIVKSLHNVAYFTISWSLAQDRFGNGIRVHFTYSQEHDNPYYPSCLVCRVRVPFDVYSPHTIRLAESYLTCIELLLVLVRLPQWS